MQQDSLLEPTRLSARMQEAERLGYQSIWLTGGVRPGSPSPLETMAFAAGVTERIDLGIAVLISPLFSPLHLARSVATIDRLSAGRLTLGVGLGRGGDTYLTHGVPMPSHRGRHFEADVIALRSLLAEEITTAPDFGLSNEPRPLEPRQEPTPPIWFGARSDSALERAARLGDGWIGAGSMPLSDFRTALDKIHTYLSAHQREPATFEIAKRVLVHVGPRDTRTVEAIGHWFGMYHGDPSAGDRIMVWGSADQVVTELSRLRTQGVGTLVLSPVSDEDEQMHLLAEHVCQDVAAPA